MTVEGGGPVRWESGAEGAAAAREGPNPAAGVLGGIAVSPPTSSGVLDSACTKASTSPCDNGLLSFIESPFFPAASLSIVSHGTRPDADFGTIADRWDRGGRFWLTGCVPFGGIRDL